LGSLILIRFSEIGVKGANRSFFEQKLAHNIRVALRRVGRFSVSREHGRIFARPEEDAPIDRAIAELQSVFGIAGAAEAIEVDFDFEILARSVVDWMAKTLVEPFLASRRSSDQSFSFKVRTRRANKSFPMTSQEISSELGARAIARWPWLKVDVHKPQETVSVEIRERSAYVYTRSTPGPGGIAVGTAGRVVLMLSGGIDSPVAGWMMMRRGVRLDAVYMHAPPYTSHRSREKVLALARVLSRWHGAPISVHVVPFTPIQEAIVRSTDERLRVVLYRRFMTRIAQSIAREVGALALVTGDSLGQVASQTLENLAVVSEVARIPILRPLISMDKLEIVRSAEKIGTYAYSIQPFPDCCSLFLPASPKTRSKFPEVHAAETSLDIDSLVSQAVDAEEVFQPSWDEDSVQIASEEPQDRESEPALVRTPDSGLQSSDRRLSD